MVLKSFQQVFDERAVNIERILASTRASLVSHRRSNLGVRRVNISAMSRTTAFTLSINLNEKVHKIEADQTADTSPFTEIAPLKHPRLAIQSLMNDSASRLNN